MDIAYRENGKVSFVLNCGYYYSKTLKWV